MQNYCSEDAGRREVKKYRAYLCYNLQLASLPGCLRHTSSLLTGGGETAKSSVNVLSPKKIFKNVLYMAIFGKKIVELRCPL